MPLAVRMLFGDGAEGVVDVVALPLAAAEADERRPAEHIAAVLQHRVHADPAAGRVGRNRARHDRDFRLQHVVEVALRRTFEALNGHALDELLGVFARKPVGAQPDLLGHARAADVGRAGPDSGRQDADRHDVARHRQRVDDVAGDDLRSRRLLHVDLRCLTGDGNRLFERADFHVGVDRDDDFRRHLDGLARDSAEAGERKGQLVGAGAQRVDAIASLVVGDRRANFFDDRGARGFDRDARKHSARFVPYLADDLCLGVCERRQQYRRARDQRTKNDVRMKSGLHEAPSWATV